MEFNDLPADLLNKISDRLALTTWVVLIRIDGKLTYVIDPGRAGRPWSGEGEHGHKRANAIAAEAKADGYEAEARTWGEAWGLLLKEYGGKQKLEEAMFKRMVDKHKNIQENPTLKKRL